MRGNPRTYLGVAAAVCAAALAASVSARTHAPDRTHAPRQAGEVSPPPTHAGFDYQIGGPYTPPAGVRVVSRDHEASPAAGLYTICYVNAFQAQPEAEKEWDADLLLRDSAGKAVYDDQWGEALLDLRTDAKRKRVATKVNAWIDQCAAKGFNAVEPDNYDSYTRSRGLLDAADAQAFIRLLSRRAHADGLAIGQKNTAELAGSRHENGLDFAITEECGRYDECGAYTDAFGDHVIDIEYSGEGMARACARWGRTLSIVRRDLAVSPAGSGGHLRKGC
ncbi:endo alpha-1,4 polygalactosaminidase [Streptomyces sp. NPDC007264]|uniref:endo alpha-1,4 polygalactosaminidase n=1 Tax=Streptomyces sp. NPDC007264 TaxID=3364777 RepID=UPI0036DC0754